MRLVSIAALLRRYSLSPHPLLRLLSHVPALPSSDLSCFTYYLVLPCKSCQLYTTGLLDPFSFIRSSKILSWAGKLGGSWSDRASSLFSRKSRSWTLWLLVKWLCGLQTWSEDIHVKSNFDRQISRYLVPHPGSPNGRGSDACSTTTKKQPRLG
jgi:hypothetical protein